MISGESGLKLNRNLTQRQNANNNTLNIKDKLADISKTEKSQQCKC